MEISEALFDAVGILIDKKIQSIKFDETIEATVTDAKKASSGEYIVSTGAAKFTAYSYDTQYREKDVVLVTIPQGNYDNQKIIVSKKVTNQNDPMVYQTPFEKFINISNNLIKDTSSLYSKGIGIWANYDDTENTNSKYAWPTDIEFNEADLIPIWEENCAKSPLQGYLMLGVQAQFASYLADYYTVQGNYGLALQITFKEPSLNQTWNKYVFLDSDSFFGDPYNFETYYIQEEVFNISEYVNYPIVGLKLYLYQRNNFKDNEGNDIPTLDDEDFGSVSPNIYIKDPFVCVGIPIDTFQGDTAEIYCDNDLTYTKNQVPAYYVFMPNNKASMFLFRGGTLYWSNSEPTSAADLSLYLGTSIDVNQEGYFYKKVAQLENSEQATFIVDDRTTRNTKNIQLRWIHKDESSGIIKALSYDDIFSTDYEIRWYRYKLGAQSPDEFAGAHWERYYGVTDEPDENQDWGKTQENDEATNQLQIKIIPNVNYQTEQIKAIILKKESDNIYQRIAISNILTFTNDTQISNPATILDMNALAIKYDDEDNYNGNFYVYNHSNQLESKLLSNPRTLTAVFDPNEHNVNNKAVLSDYTSVTWYFPRNRTMITTTEQDQESNPNFIVIKNTNSISYQIKQTLDLNAVNNTVRLEVLKDGQLFTAYTTMYFGENSLNGSPYTFFVQWENNNNILNISGDELSITGYVFIKDEANMDLENGPRLSASWLVYDCPGASNIITSKKLSSCYLPILNSSESIFSSNNKPEYYLTTSDAVKYFDMKQQKFVDVFNDNCAPQQYGLYSDNTKDDFDFQIVEFVESPIDKNTGRVQDKGWENIESGDKFYYSSKRRFFVKYNGFYILDPWDTFNEAEVYYYPKFTNKNIYDNTNSSLFKIQVDNSEYPWQITISYNGAQTNVDINSLLILHLELEDFGDFNLTRDIPIFIANLNYNKKICDLTVTSEIRYDTSGIINFTRLPYRVGIQTANNGIKYHTLDVSSGDTFLDGYWKLKIADYGDLENISQDNFLPRLREMRTNRVNSGEYDIPVLDPISVYIPEARPYGVQFFTKDENNIYKPVLTIPVLVYQNNYPLQALNEWNGKDIVTDETNGTIVAKGFSAGKKESDNTFSGVVIGDWSHDAPNSLLASNTGVYGFNHGALAYAFKDDGTGFIGKDGRGRIYFDGNQSQIYSNNWLGNNAEGMLIDIDDGYIKMISPIQDSVVSNSTFYSASDSQFNTKTLPFLAQDLITINQNQIEDISHNQYTCLFQTPKYYRVNGDIYNAASTYYQKIEDIFQEIGAEDMNNYIEDNFVLASKEYISEFLIEDLDGIHFDENKQPILLYTKGALSQFSQVTFSDRYDSTTQYYKLNDKKIKLPYESQSSNPQLLQESYVKDIFLSYRFTDLAYHHIYKKFASDDNEEIFEVASGEKYSNLYIYELVNYNESTEEYTHERIFYPRLIQYGYLQLDTTFHNPHNLCFKNSIQDEQLIQVQDGDEFDSNKFYFYYENSVPVIFKKYDDYKAIYYQKAALQDTYNPELNYYKIETYQRTNDKKYITLSSQEPIYPLAIGKDNNVQRRPFRISWDGTTYIENGVFNGIITAEAGFIGGWSIGTNTLVGGDTTFDSSQGIKTNNITIQGKEFNVLQSYGEVGYHVGNNNSNILGLKSNTRSIAIEALNPIDITDPNNPDVGPTNRTIRLTAMGQIILEGAKSGQNFGDAAGILINSLKGIYIQNVSQSQGDYGQDTARNRLVVDSSHAGIASDSASVSCEGYNIGIHANDGFISIQSGNNTSLTATNGDISLTAGAGNNIYLNVSTNISNNTKGKIYIGNDDLDTYIGNLIADALRDYVTVATYNTLEGRVTALDGGGNNSNP